MKYSTYTIKYWRIVIEIVIDNELAAIMAILGVFALVILRWRNQVKAFDKTGERSRCESKTQQHPDLAALSRTLQSLALG